MSSYGTLEDKPEIDKGSLEELIRKLKPLSGNVIHLGPGQAEGGTANEDRLRELINRGQRDSTKANWSAADYNNLACAHFWLHKERGKAKAIEYFGKALEDLSKLSEIEKKTIENNLKLLGGRSTGNNKE
jgi:cell division FtsZ-interacting protein ZapD